MPAPCGADLAVLDGDSGRIFQDMTQRTLCLWTPTPCWQLRSGLMNQRLETHPVLGRALHPQQAYFSVGHAESARPPDPEYACAV